jgi:hypothetical protein
MKSSKLFLNNITVIDHAYIGDDGRQHGGSFHASFTVEGKVDAVEQVVIDFSAVKKQIKAIVDDNTNGFDHKLWVIQGYSSADVIVHQPQPGYVTIKSAALELTGPLDMMRLVNATGYVKDEIAADLGAYVQAELVKLHPGIDIAVKCKLNEVMFTNTDKAWPFRYTHGLRNSTSWGCKNIAHGHLSWLEVEHDDKYNADCKDCKGALATMQARLESEWHGAVLIDAANVVDFGTDFITIAYTTSRGKFTGKYRAPYVKWKLFEHETTVEHIVNAFVLENGYFLERAHVKAIYISEGLAKGAMMEFDNV